jgi:hypothetical protein
MSNPNITLRDRHSITEQLAERIEVLEMQNKRLESFLSENESKLRSIFDRIETGEEVWLCYGTGERIRIQAVPVT